MNKDKKKAVIYGVKTGDTYHYIGKTINTNMNGEICNSNVRIQYANPDIREVFTNNKKVEVENLLEVTEDQWYDEKLHEVVDKHKDKHPLLNAQWMLDGKRGIEYWKGKTRDKHTLQRLSESKYRKVCQYDVDGYFIKTWESVKKIATQVFGDYEVINGGGRTKLYSILKSSRLESRFRLGSYWLYEHELINYFGSVPKIINIRAILSEEKRKRIESRKKQVVKFRRRYTVIQYDESYNEIQRFDNISHCGYKLKISKSMVAKICRGTVFNNNYILKYGEKTLQDANIKYPDYKINYKPNKRIPKPKVKTRTRYSVEHFISIQDNPNDCSVGTIVTYDSVKDCAEKLSIKESHVRFLCGKKSTAQKKRRKNYFKLWYGQKKTIIVS